METRSLAAIMFTDIVGYTSMMAEDEQFALQVIEQHREILKPRVEKHNGRWLKEMGDGTLSSFPSSIDAVNCATEIQEVLKQVTQFKIRIGIHLGDVVFTEDDVYGDGVNIAARIEPVSAPGGIAISGQVYDTLSSNKAIEVKYLGKKALKHVTRPVRIYSVSSSNLPTAALFSDHDGVSQDVGAAFEFSAPDKPSIAILPFNSIGSDPDQDFLADGIRFGVQASLVQLSGLFLVNAAALNAYRQTEKSSVAAGLELDVRYILEGSVHQAGNRVRVTVQLTEVSDKHTIWAEHYDGVLDDVFNFQDDITREVVASLNVKLRDSETGRIWFGKLSSPEAREYYYRGSIYFYELNKDDNALARQMFEKLYQVQADSVTGPGNIALTHWIDGFFNWTDPQDQSMDQAAEWAKKAMEYKDNNGLGHAVYGYVQLLSGNYDAALKTCLAGVRLRSSCPVAHGLLGLVLNYGGDSEAAANSAKEALKLEKSFPIWLINLLATAYRDSGKIELSIPAANESMKREQGNDARLILCSDYLRLSKPDEARSIADEIRAADPEFGLAAYAKSQPYKNPATLDNLISSLRTAGLPD